MTSKILLATIATVLTASIILPAMAISFAPWQIVSSSSVTAIGSQVTQASVTAAAPIPIQSSVLGGFAWFYASGPNTVFAATTHNGVRDSNQNPNGWHVHNVQLTTGTATSTACIAGVSSDTTAGLSIQGDAMKVNVHDSELSGPLTGSAVAFSIVVDSGCSSGLGVVVNP